MTAPAVTGARPRTKAGLARAHPARPAAATPRRAPAPHRALAAQARPRTSDKQVRTRVRLLFAMSALALLTIVAFHVVIAQGQVSLDRLAEQTHRAELRYENVRLAHASLAAPERMLARAAELGLVEPAAPPIPVPVEGWVPPTPIDGSATLDAWTAIKPSLEPRP